MIHSTENVIRHKVGLLNLAEELQNVSRARRHPVIRAARFASPPDPDESWQGILWRPEQNDYQPYLAINDIGHTKTKVRSPQTNGICERIHKTILDEFYKVAFRKRTYLDLELPHRDLDVLIEHYNNERTHQGKIRFGRTPIKMIEDEKKSGRRIN